MELNQDYFALFNLPRQFVVDQSLLAEKFRQLQREVHPDRHVGEGKHQQLLSIQFASYINMAYQTLKSPLPRARYLLELAQTPVDTEKMTVTDSDFLFQQMQWRDTLSEAVKQQSKQTLEQLSQAVSDYSETLFSAFIHDYDEENFDRAKETVVKLHFVEKVMAEIERIDFSKITENSNLSSQAG